MTADPPGPPPPARANPLGRNVVAQLLHGTFGQAGQRLFAAPTFLPMFLFSLTGSELLVGVARGMQGLGTVLSPPLGAALIGHRDRIKWLGLAVGLAARMQILVIALAVLWLSPSFAVWVVLAALTLLGFCSGIQSVAFNALRARVIPRRRRGLVLGARNFAGGIAAALLAAWAGPALLGAAPEPAAWARLFLVSFVVSTAGLLGLALTREVDCGELAPRRDLRATFAAGAEVLRTDAGFTRFFSAYVLGSIGRMGIPFYTLQAAQRLGAQDGVLPGALLGALTTIWLLTGTTTRLLWGTIGDRRGHRDVFLAGLALWILAQLLLMTSDGVAGLFAFFTLAGLAIGGFETAANNLVVEYGRPRDLPLRLATLTSAVHAVAALAPVVGGVIATFAGYTPIFVVCVIGQSIALATIIRAVPEPRDGRPLVPIRTEETLP